MQNDILWFSLKTQATNLLVIIIILNMLYICIYIRTNYWEITKTPENLELCCSILYKSTNGETAQPNICVYMHICLWLHKYAFSFSFPSLCRLFLTNIMKNSKTLSNVEKPQTMNTYTTQFKTPAQMAVNHSVFVFFLLLKPFYTKWCSAEHLMQVKSSQHDQMNPRHVFTVTLAELCPPRSFSNMLDILWLIASLWTNELSAVPLINQWKRGERSHWNQMLSLCGHAFFTLIRLNLHIQ